MTNSRANSPMCKRLTMPNGLDVLAIHHTQAPVVALQAWIRFGSADESEKMAGLAHLFEHILFKGTERRGVGQIAREVECLGGDLNAYTTYDHTVMHMTLGAAHLEAGLDILSDSLLNSVVDETELMREREVVLEEIRRRNDMPAAIASDLLRELLFKGHPYARPVIGFSENVSGMPRADILRAYKANYNAKNIFLVVSGDFDESALPKIVDRHFAKLADGARPGSRAPLAELSRTSDGFRHHASPDALLHFGWRGPTGASSDTAALDAFALILGQGESSRLVRKLVHDEKLARDIGAGYWGPKDGGSFQIGLRGVDNMQKKFPALVDGLAECLAAPIGEAELNKAKKNLLASATYSKETVDSLAQRFGYYESIAGDWEGDTRYLADIRRLNVADLERVREMYLPWSEALAAGIFPGKAKLPNFAGPHPTKRAQKPVKRAKEDFGVDTFNYRGLKVLVKTITHLPVFSLRWAGLGGIRFESAAQSGLGTLWARTVASGGTAPDGKRWSREELTERVDSLSAGLAAFHGKNSFGYQVDGLSDDFAELFEILLAVKMRPTFEAPLVKEEIDHQISDIRTAADAPSGVASRMFHEAIFGKHPYGRFSLGEAKFLRTAKSDTLLGYHRKLETQPQVLSIVGNVTGTEVLRQLKRLVGAKSFATASRKLPRLPVRFPTKAVRLYKTLAKEQSHLLLGFPSCTLFDADRWPLLGLAAVLSGQGGRLFLELRDKMSLCYTVSPTHMEGIDGGYFAFYIATSPDKVDTATEALHVEIRKLVDGGVSEDEWQKACTFYVGNHEIEQQRLSTQAMGMALDELYGLGFRDYFLFERHFRALRAADLNRVAKRYFGGKNLAAEVRALAGPRTGPP